LLQWRQGRGRTMITFYEFIARCQNIPHELATELFYAVQFVCQYQGPSKQMRDSGEPYLDHLATVGWNVMQVKPDYAQPQNPNGEFMLYLDDEVLIAAILHDIIEDTNVNCQQLVAGFSKGRGELFGRRVGELVAACSKRPLESFFQSDKPSKEEIIFCKERRRRDGFERWTSYARNKDWMVIPIRIEDRIHNQTTLAGLDEERQRITSRDTMDNMMPILENEAKEIVPAEYHTWLKKRTELLKLDAIKFLPDEYKITITRDQGF